MMKRANSGVNPSDLVDSISALPDSILSLILSYIPTKNAVATSVLSKRWKSLWKAVHNLDFKLNFCKRGCYQRSHTGCGEGWSAVEDLKFSHFVNNVLILHDGGFLNKFSLVWKPLCIPSHVILWTSFAITRNVHELSLCVDNCADEPFEIPSIVFGCETLKYLVLDGNMFVSDSIAVCLPRLERLILVSVYFHSEETFQKLISGCPVLYDLFVKMDLDVMTEYIQTYRGMMTNLFKFVISSTSLRCFTLDIWLEQIGSYDNLPYCSLELKAPSLEYLDVKGAVPCISVRENLSSLVTADLDIDISADDLSDVSNCNSFVDAICACDCAKTLRLSTYVFSAISRATIGFSTKFKRLTELKIGADCCYCSSLQDFIQRSDCLEVLIVQKEPPVFDSYNHTHSYRTNLEEIPRCFSTSLKTVQFLECGDLDCDLELIGYMLMHGSALEDMSIYCYLARDHNKFELLYQEICAFPRKSLACKVKLIWQEMGLCSLEIL